MMEILLSLEHPPTEFKIRECWDLQKIHQNLPKDLETDSDTQNTPKKSNKTDTGNKKNENIGDTKDATNYNLTETSFIEVISKRSTIFVFKREAS